jgi:hypothetical protein
MIDSLILLLGPGVLVAVLWSPILLIGRLRSLFRRLPPGGSVGISYAAVAVGLSVPFLGGTAAVLATTGTEGAALSNAILDTAFRLTVGYVVALPLIAGVGLPRLGVDWDPTGYGLSTWSFLVVAAVWYATVFAVPLALFAFVLALPTG